MAKHLIDLDEDALASARAALGTTTMRDTVNEALRRAAAIGETRLTHAIGSLAEIDFDDRADAWR